MYQFKQIDNQYIVSIANHADLTEALQHFCEQQNIRAGIISGLGAVDEATLRFYNPQTKQYEDQTFCEQMEIANLTGNISTLNDAIYLHLHIVLGRADYTALAGHLLTARISGACELLITAFDTTLPRHKDAETGLNMYF